MVSSLIIARPGHQVLQGGHNKNGKAQIFVLEPDEVILFINGANCDYGRSQVTGQVTFMQSKRDTLSKLSFFMETIANVKLTTEQAYNKYLGPTN